MKIISMFTLILSVLVIAPHAFAEDMELDSQIKRMSYGLGHNIGTNVKLQFKDVDEKALFEGISAAIAGKESRVSTQQAAKDIEAYQKQLGEEGRAKGEAFLKDNKNKEGVKTLESGLQYKVLSSGSGKSPKSDSEVVVHYRGTLTDGTEFDSSHKRGEPATFPVMGVIKGFSEALMLMKEGDKWMLYIPSDLGYGQRGAGATIGPNETLIFELELLEVKEISKAQ